MTTDAGLVDMAEQMGYALRLPRALKAQLERLAKREHRSLNGQIVAALEQLIEQAERDGKLPPAPDGIN